MPYFTTFWYDDKKFGKWNGKMTYSDYQIHNHPEYNKMRTLATVGLTVAFTLFFNIMLYRNPEMRKFKRESGQRINYSVPPEIRDVDGNGVNDFVFETLDGNHIPLYGQRDGSYSFLPENRNLRAGDSELEKKQ